MRMFKPLIVLLAVIPLLSSCAWFQPNEKVIEYDEEVKLHDGSMIWVHIKRHYHLVGGALGDSGGLKAGYAPTEVEISWDTGFPNVGRTSVFYKESIYFIEKYNNVWYVVGYGHRTSNEVKLDESMNCRKVGLNINKDYHCQFTINESGKSVNQEPKDIGLINMNILNPEGLKNNKTAYFPKFLNGAKISWEEKLKLQNTQNIDSQLINRPYSYLIH